jgi:protein ImuB
VRRGLRRREAQGRCPGVTVIEHDPGSDARAFEPVVAAIEAFAPGVEIVRPGVAAVGTRGPSRYFGGDHALATRITAAVHAVITPSTGCVGIADGPFAAELAARSATVVPRRTSPAFLAPFPVAALNRPDLTDLLIRLGIRTLGDLAALPAADVLARFGDGGAVAHRLARGLDERPLAARTPPPDLVVTTELDPPADRVDIAAFAARALAAELHDRLAGLGLACTRVGIEAETEHGEHLTRFWRHDGPLTAGAIAERVRWQLDGWLTAGGTTAGITLLRLVPDEVAPDNGRQLGFWGGEAVADERAARALARVQGMLGPDAVVTAVIGGGRSPAEQVRLVPWGDPRTPARPCGPQASPVGGAETPAWPGRVPAPAPATVPPAPLPADVAAADGTPVRVEARGLATAAPARISVAGGPWTDVVGWAGPWPADERWWDPPAHHRRARLQVQLAGGRAHLVALEGGRWWIEATYD